MLDSSESDNSSTGDASRRPHHRGRHLRDDGRRRGIRRPVRRASDEKQPRGEVKFASAAAASRRAQFTLRKPLDSFSVIKTTAWSSTPRLAVKAPKRAS